MLLGVAGLVPGDWKSMDSGVMKNVVEHGFATVQVRVNDPLAATDRDINRVKSLFADHGLAMAQTVGNYGGGLVSEDEEERASTIKFVKRMVNLTRRLGSPNTYFRPGSLNPRGAWLPHPENRSDKVFDRLVDSGKQVCKVAENEGIMMAIEGGVVCPLYSAQRVRDFIDAVGSKALAFNMDPVNFVGSIEQAYDTTTLLNEFYDLLPDRIVGAHAKDFTLVEKLLPHFEEAIIGRGMLDQETFLQGMQRVCPTGHILVEHLPDEKVPIAADGLRKAAKRAGIEWGRP
ncbi:MAG: sugar phosphate isomerase/epimerase family protein [Dehalococcoidia bacterium]